MSIVKNLNQYSDECVYFCDSIKNNVMINGNFIRILYCTHHFTMNGIYLHFSLSDISYEKYYQKYKCIFNLETYNTLVSDITKIEKNILKKISVLFPEKQAQYKIAEQLHNGYLKIFLPSVPRETRGTFLLKISGVWETEDSYGVTYKFTHVQDHF